jgi:hypothetical protein
MHVNINRHIRAYYRANSASDAFCGLMYPGEEISFQINLFRHGDDAHRAGMNTQFTPFAVVSIYFDTGHGLFPPVL